MISRKLFPMRCCVIVAAGMLAGSCLPLVAQELAQVPSDAAQQRAAKLIEEVYGEEHARAKTSAEKTALANKLLKEAAASEDLTNRYVLLRVARDMATQAGDVETVFQAIEEMGKSFQVDSFQLKGAALSQARKSASLTKQREALAEQALALIEEAVERDDFAAAEYLGQLALDSARKVRERELTRRIVTRNKMVAEISEAYSVAKDAFRTLEESPADAETNLAAGTYLCFMKGDWDKGIPMLALGKGGQATKLAIKELEGVTDVAGQVAIGDGWWAVSETTDGLAAERARERAVSWYRLASPKLTGLAKSKVEKRISEIPKERLEGLPAPKLSEREPVLPPSSSPPPLAIAPFDSRQAKDHQQAWAKYLGVPVETTNSIGMKLVLIPPGEFDMGSTEAEVAKLQEEARARSLPDWYLRGLPIEAPKHRVRITKPFYLCTCEVTQADYKRVMGSNSSDFKENPTHPVETVNWGDASAFCRKLTELSREQASRAEYRLPTEAEWEYSCRAGTTTVWSSGDDEAALKDIAWYVNNSAKMTHPVRQKRPNAWGLYDMHGNVWELCHDWISEMYYKTSPTDDPNGPSEGVSRAIRGGCWYDRPPLCRASFRRGCNPGDRRNAQGFRVARSVTSPLYSR